MRRFSLARIGVVLAALFWIARNGESARAQPLANGPAPSVLGAPRIAEPGGLLRSNSATWRVTARASSAGPVVPADIPPPRVAILATVPGQATTSLIFQPLDAPKPAPPVATFAHLPRTTVAGAVVPYTDHVLVIAGTEEQRDPVFGSSLLMVGGQEETRLIVDRVCHGTRPLVLDDGRAIVLRGVGGPEPTQVDLAAGRRRIDLLTIEQIGLSRVETKVLSQFHGYLASVAGVLRHEIFVYRVAPAGADIIGVDADSGRERTILRPLPAFAHDFSVDALGQALLFANADPLHPGQWAAERLDVTPPPPSAPVVAPSSRVAVETRLERLETALHPAMAPTAWIGRTVALNKDGTGLQVLGPPGASLKVPFTAGVDLVREFFVAQDQIWALAVHHAEGQLPQPVVIQASSMSVQKIAVPPRSLVDLAGVLEPPGTPRPQIRQLLPRKSLEPVKIQPGLFRQYIPPAPSHGDAGSP